MKKLLACCSLVIALYSCQSISSGSPKNTVAGFIEATKEGNLENAKKYITKSDISMMELGQNLLAKIDPDGAKEMKDKIMKEFKDKTKDARVEIKDEKIDGDKATVNIEFIDQGRTETHPFNLIKEDGQWKISLLSTGMKNSGTNQQDIEEAMKHVNVDSLTGLIDMRMEGVNKDSIKKVMQEALKEVDKLKGAPENK